MKARVAAGWAAAMWVICGTHATAADYDTANAYARAGNTGMAVLFYERALLFDPRDADTLVNLREVRKKAGLPPQNESWLATHARFANPNALYVLGVLGILSVGVGSLVARFKPATRGFGWAAIVIGVPLTAVAAVDCLATWPVAHAAVVLHATALRASPVAGADTLVTLPEGSVVEWSDRYRPFTLIETRDGRGGWVSDADLAAVSTIL